jgi:hypothetical protein
MLVLPWLGCLATYVGYLLCASLSRLGGDIYPITVYVSSPVGLCMHRVTENLRRSRCL